MSASLVRSTRRSQGPLSLFKDVCLEGLDIPLPTFTPGPRQAVKCWCSYVAACPGHLFGTVISLVSATVKKNVGICAPPAIEGNPGEPMVWKIFVKGSAVVCANSVSSRMRASKGLPARCKPLRGPRQVAKCWYGYVAACLGLLLGTMMSLVSAIVRKDVGICDQPSKAPLGSHGAETLL